MAARAPSDGSTGLPYDVRKDHPYLVYDRFDFDVPVGEDGDNWDRFMVRLEEIRQSVRIIEQALEQMPDVRPVNVDDPRNRVSGKAGGLYDHRSHNRATSSSSWRE